MTDVEFFKAYGPWIFGLGYFFYKEVWPLIRDRVKPEAAAARRKEEQEAATARRREEDHQTALLFHAFQENTRVLSSLEGTLNHIVTTIGDLADNQKEHNAQLAELYGHFKIPRRQRGDNAPKEGQG